jgi:hypothetical protein
MSLPYPHPDGRNHTSRPLPLRPWGYDLMYGGWRTAALATYSGSSRAKSIPQGSDDP